MPPCRIIAEPGCCGGNHIRLQGGSECSARLALPVSVLYACSLPLSVSWGCSPYRAALIRSHRSSYPPCPIETLEKAAEDAQAAFKAVPHKPNLSHFRSPEWQAVTEAGEHLKLAQEGERVEC